LLEKSKPKALGALLKRKEEKDELESLIGLIVVKFIEEYSKMHDPLFRAKL
jgi:hypothetical protein